jgi:hypothetical protein
MDLALVLRHGGLQNDINMLQRSQIFSRFAEDNAPVVQNEVNGHEYNKCYCLSSGIYREWSTLVTIHDQRERGREK